jgi:hypothetical protein
MALERVVRPVCEPRGDFTGAGRRYCTAQCTAKDPSSPSPLCNATTFHHTTPISRRTSSTCRCMTTWGIVSYWCSLGMTTWGIVSYWCSLEWFALASGGEAQRLRLRVRKGVLHRPRCQPSCGLELRCLSSFADQDTREPFKTGT